MPVLGDEGDAGVADLVDRPSRDVLALEQHASVVGRESDRPAPRPARAGRCPRPRRPPRSRRRAPRGRPRERPASREALDLKDRARRAPPSGLSSRNSTGRPTIISASSSFEVCAGVVSPTTLPRRRTVIRSAISSTSSSLWLMNTMVLPDSRNRRRLPNSSGVSCGVSTAVGSSRIRISTPRYERLQDLDALFLTDGEILDRGAWVDRRTRRTRRAPADCARWPPRDRACRPPLVAQDDVLGHGERDPPGRSAGAPCRCRWRSRPVATRSSTRCRAPRSVPPSAGYIP